MSATKRGKHKQQAEVSEEEEDFETFVRESLEQLSKGQKQIIQFKRALSTIISLITATPALKCYIFLCVCVCVCVCVCAFPFSSLLNIFHIFFIVYRVYTFLFFSLLT